MIPGTAVGVGERCFERPRIPVRSGVEGAHSPAKSDRTAILTIPRSLSTFQPGSFGDKAIRVEVARCRKLALC